MAPHQRIPTTLRQVLSNRRIVLVLVFSFAVVVIFLSSPSRSYYSDDDICATDGTECSAAPPKSFGNFAAGLASPYWRLGIRSQPKSPEIPSLKPQSPLRQAVFPPSRRPANEKASSWLEQNNRNLKALFRCIEYSNCKENQSKVVILNSYQFVSALNGATNDEAIWATSITLGLKNLGYTYLFAKELDRALQFYQLFPDLVVAILMEQDNVIACFNDKVGCVKSKENLDGLPIWKLFSFYWWADSSHPISPRWTLSPHNYTMENANNHNHYLGYSVEPARAGCALVRAARKKEAQAKAKAAKGVKVAKEVEKGTGDAAVELVDGKGETEAELVPYAYLMAKHAHHFAPGGLRGWDPATFEQVAKEAGITFVAGVVDSDDRVTISPNVVENRGAMERKMFVETVAEASVAIGMGQPFASATPYEALCFGVPFINPIWNWDRSNPSDRAKWEVQHGLLKFLDPPYVYNVFKDDTAGLIKAIKAAVANPIDHHVPEAMLMRSVEARLDKMLQTNWYIEALELLAERFEEGKGPFWRM
ncbi:hypothetical protein DL93DRAFT_2088306 [Clavulina sp. PMI_390]|nr:hypothetical protein DL93DRAFT_2088306 [Clavulina sp. PMI_390]